MGILVFFLTISTIVLYGISARPAENIKITIDTIVQDDHITGTVRGLTAAGRAGHKVIVYIKTDQWYIHPYERGGEGKSFASIRANGSWTIGTIRREFAASAIAALLVKQDSKVPVRSVNVRAIPNEAITVLELEGTPDYGKL